MTLPPELDFSGIEPDSNRNPEYHDGSAPYWLPTPAWYTPEFWNISDRPDLQDRVKQLGKQAHEAIVKIIKAIPCHPETNEPGIFVGVIGGGEFLTAVFRTENDDEFHVPLNGSLPPAQEE